MNRKIRILLVRAFLICCFFVFLQTVTAAQSTDSSNGTSNCTTVQLGAFGKSVTYSVAQQKGFFAREGLCVNYSRVVSSTQQFNDFLAGNYNIISTAVDNVANRVVNQGRAISMVAGQDKGPGLVLAINTAKGVNSIADLRGKPIAVDAPDSGFVFALRKILAADGLYFENGDYTFQLLGGSANRYRSLIDPDTDTVASLINPPFTVQVQSPVAIVAKFSDYVVPYQSAGYAVTQDYAAANGPTITAFIRALIQAGSFVANPNNHAVVVNAIVAEQNLPPAQAEAVLALALDPASGENFDAKLDRQGMINVIDLRTEFNGFTNPPNSKAFVRPAKKGFYDAEFWRAARKGT